jgi:hypothetical protein
MLRTAAGLALDIAAVQKQSFTAVDDAGAADAYALTIAPAITAYAKYQAFTFVAVAPNTGPSTLAVNGLPPKAIKKWKVGAKLALEGADIAAGQLSVVVYDGADFVLLTAPVGDHYALVREEQASGVDGGGFTSGAWQKRSLNTKVIDTGGDVSLSAGAVTLTAGVWEFEAWGIGHEVGDHKLRLQNTTDATTVEVGLNERARGGSGDPTISSRAAVDGRFTISANKTFELQHRCSSTRGTDGFGNAAGFGVVEVYSAIKFRKVR